MSIEFSEKINLLMNRSVIKSYAFEIEIPDLKNKYKDIVYQITDFTLGGKQIDTNDIRIGNNNIKYPVGKIQYNECTVSFVLDQDTNDLLDFLEDKRLEWENPTNYKNMFFNFNVYLLNRAMERVKQFKIKGAFVYNIGGISLSYSSSDPITCNVSIGANYINFKKR